MGMVLIPVSVLHKGTDSVGCALCALPRSKQLRQWGAWRAHCPRWPVHLNHFPRPGHSVSWEQLLRCALCLPWGANFKAVTLLADVNYPGSQEDLVSNWSLLTVWWRMPSLGLRLPLAFGSCFAHLPLYLQWEEGPVCSQLPLLWYLLNFLFCEWARLCLRLELFAGKFSLSLFFFFFLSGYSTVWVAISR